jgi:hypothetical protein
MAVSHICSGGTLKMSEGSTSIVSHADAGNLAIELTRLPSRVADEDSRTHRGRHLKQLEREFVRGGEQHTRTDLLLLVVRPLRFRHQHPGPLGINGTANPQPQVRVDADRRIRLDQRPRRFLHLSIHDEAERTFIGVVAEKHYGSGEIRIGHLRHREQKDRSGTRHIFNLKAGRPEGRPLRSRSSPLRSDVAVAAMVRTQRRTFRSACL